jgi:hypothetical protein
MKLGVTLDILNQKATPAFFADTLANRPAFGFEGRIFVDTNVPSTGLYRDTGSSWIQIADQGAGTTGTLQQVTTNGNTTSQGISITAGGLSSNIVTIAENGLSSSANYITGRMAGNDNWKIYGTGTTTDLGEMVFQVGDNGSSYASGNGERFRFSYDVTGGTGTAKDVFIVDYDLSYFNTSLGVNTDTPTAAFDVHSGVSVIAQLNQTTATNNSLLAFQNAGAGLWRIGSFYNAGANNFGVFDVIGNIQPITIKKTTGQTFIGTETTSSGLLVVNSSTGDNQIVAIGATAPSIRVRNAGTSPSRQFGLGLATASNNFIQGTTGGEFCIFNGSTTASPILFGIYNSVSGFVEEDARISAAGNLLINTTTDAGQRLQVNGTTYLNGNVGIGTSTTTNPLTLQGNGVSPLVMSINSANPNCDIFMLSSASTNAVRLRNGADDFSVFTNGVQRTTVTSSGNLLIATTTDAGQKLQVNGNSYLNGYLLVGTSSSGGYKSEFYGGDNYTMLINQNSGVTSSIPLSINHFASSGAIRLIVFSSAGTEVGSITTNGTTTSYNIMSDYRLKEDLKDFNGLSLINSIKTYDYKLKSNNERMFGVLAHELQTVLPYSVNGDKDGENFQGVDYSKIVPLLVKAIQELNIKIENLK